MKNSFTVEEMLQIHDRIEEKVETLQEIAESIGADVDELRMAYTTFYNAYFLSQKY